MSDCTKAATEQSWKIRVQSLLLHDSKIVKISDSDNIRTIFMLNLRQDVITTVMPLYYWVKHLGTYLGKLLELYFTADYLYDPCHGCISYECDNICLHCCWFTSYLAGTRSGGHQLLWGQVTTAPRLKFIQDLSAPSSSVWLHVITHKPLLSDPFESHYQLNKEWGRTSTTNLEL